MRRRQVLSAVGGAVVFPIAGCLDGEDGDDGTGQEETPAGDESDGANDRTGSGGNASSDDRSGDDAGGSSDGDESGSSEGEDTNSDDEDNDERLEPDETGDWPSGSYVDYETTVVRLYDDEDPLGAVLAAVASSGDQRYLGLSDAESLPPDAGMLFVYETVSSRTFVMRRMDFGIDIVYVDADGTITEIHHAPEPGPDENGENQQYPGTGQYVLEVPYRWTERHDVEVGDRIEFDR